MINLFRKSVAQRLSNIHCFSEFQKRSIDQVETQDGLKASILKDIYDYEGAIKQFKKLNQQARNPEKNGYTSQLKSILGKNYERYADSIATTGERITSTIQRIEGAFGERMVQPKRFVQRIPPFQGISQQYPESINYPLTDLASFYKPVEACQNLNNNQLAVFNIPLNVDAEELKAFITSGFNTQVIDATIETCKLNMNAYAILTFSGEDVEQFKKRLDKTRYNDCVLDVKSSVDAQAENAWDRTIVIQNLNPESTLHQVIRQASQYGRVMNYLVPTKLVNSSMPTEEQLIGALEKDKSITNPVKLLVYDLEKNTKEKKYWPSEDEFMLFNNKLKSKKPDETQMDFQDRLQNQEFQDRLKFLSAEKEYQCVKVPFHLKADYEKFLIDQKPPQIKSSFYQQLEYLYTPRYANLGFCLITYSSKFMAQRALYNINLLTSTDLATLRLPLINQPVFWDDSEMPHSNEERYGHRFKLELLQNSKHSKTIRAIKAWRGMELYEVDIQYIAHQMERIKNEQASQQDDLRTFQQENFVEPPKEIIPKEELRQKIIKELSQPQTSKEFDEAVLRQNFSSHHDTFDEKFDPLLTSSPGRRYEPNLMESELRDLISNLSNAQKAQYESQMTYAEQLVWRGQQELVDLRNSHKLPQIKGDQIDQNIQTRMISRYEQLKQKHQRIKRPLFVLRKAVETYSDEANKAIRKLNRYQRRQMSLAQQTQRKEQLLASKQKTEFSSQRSNPHQEFLEKLKRIMFGAMTAQEREELFAFNNIDQMDTLKYCKLFAKDDFGNEFLSDSIIESVREVDLPQDQEARLRIRYQEANRRALVSTLSDKFFENIRTKGKKQITQQTLAFYTHGHPTESYELEEGVDGEELVKQLNRFVAESGEEYHYEVDELTLKGYIVKSERQFFKYDLQSIVSADQQKIAKKLMSILVRKKKLPPHEAKEIVEETLKTGIIDPVIVELFKESKKNLPKIDDVQQACEKLNITRREFELHYNNDFFNEQDRYRQEIQEQMQIETKKLEFQSLNKDNIVHVRQNQYRYKDQEGNFVIPKYKRI